MLTVIHGTDNLNKMIMSASSKKELLHYEMAFFFVFSAYSLHWFPNLTEKEFTKVVGSTIQHRRAVVSGRKKLYNKNYQEKLQRKN